VSDETNEHLHGRFFFGRIRPLTFTTSCASGSPLRESALDSHLGNVVVVWLKLLNLAHAFTLMFVKISSKGRRILEAFFTYYQMKPHYLCQCEKYLVILNCHVMCNDQSCLHLLLKDHRKMMQEEITVNETTHTWIEFNLTASCVWLSCFNCYGLLIRCLRVSTVKVSKRKWETGSFYHLEVLFNGVLFSYLWSLLWAFLFCFCWCCFCLNGRSVVCL